MQLRTLGALRVEGADFNRSKPLLMLSYLALEGAKDSKHLSQLFFPQTANPAQQLSVTLSRLRKGMPNCVERDKITKKLKVQISMDATILLQTLETGKLEKGIKLYEGSFLEGFDVPDISSELEEWIYFTREFLAHRVREALISLAQQLLKQNPSEVTKANQYAEKAYLLSGAPEPNPGQFQQLYTLLVKGNSHLIAEVKSEAESFGIKLKESLGEDLTLDGKIKDALLEQPALEKQAKVQLKVKHNLLENITSFVGRSSEVLELKSLVVQENTRLLTLLGTGGIGKTRLAIQLARDILAEASVRSESYTGVYFIPLETLQSQEEIIIAIATALGLGSQTQETPFKQLQDYLKDRSYLLLLDNFEHLVKEASFVPELLRVCSGLKIVATSRVRLNLTGELVYPMGGLELPLETDTPEQARDRDAIKLFLDRAKTANLRFSLDETLEGVISICQLVNGLPLGIELAAAWVKLIPVNEIKEEIQSNFDFLESTQQDAISRHQSLRAVFEHSWVLLTKKEQEILKQLSVFRGGFKREAAREVAGASIPSLMSLTDKSLLRVNNYRFDMHPLILQYSFEKLAEDEATKENTLERHAEYFLALAQAHPNDFYKREQLPLLDQTEEELDNIWAAFDWAYDTNHTDFGLKLANELCLFWFVRDYFREGAGQFSRFLAKIDLSNPTLSVAFALNGAGLITQTASGIAEAKGLFEQSLTMFKCLDNKAGMADVHLNLGFLYLDDALSTSKEHLDEALKLARDHKLIFLEGVALLFLGHVAIEEDNLDKAIDLQTKSLELTRAIGDDRGTSRSLTALADSYLSKGDYAKAKSLIEESLAIDKTFGSPSDIAFNFEVLGSIALAQGNYDLAKQHLQSTLDVYYRSYHILYLVVMLPIIVELFAKLELWQEAAVVAGTTIFIKRYGGIENLPKQKELEGCLEKVKVALSEDQYLKYFLQGENMNLEEAVDFILKRLEA